MAPRVAFCFHDAQLSGATIWLRDFLRSRAYPAADSVVVLPGSSAVEDDCRALGIECHVLNITTKSISEAGLAEKFSLMANRIAAVKDYRKVFRAVRPNLAYVNSSVQIAPLYAARRERIPALVHVHEGWRMKTTQGLKRHAVRNWASAALFAAARGVEIFGPAPNGKRWEVSPNGVDMELADLKRQREELRGKNGFARDEKIILFLGTVSERKGVQDLAACWPEVSDKFPRARLIVAGREEPAEKNAIIHKFIKAPPARAEFWGFRSDARELIAAADFLVLPSYGEAMPISISEAMMIGTPVIARDVGDVGWQIGEGRGFLFKGDGAEVLRSAMEEALMDDARAMACAEKAQEFARKELTREKQNAQVLRMIGGMGNGEWGMEK
ncbi:MAG: glycosyltransferase [Candidatus Sumerlaeota bacterium]